MVQGRFMPIVKIVANFQELAGLDGYRMQPDISQVDHLLKATSSLRTQLFCPDQPWSDEV